MGEVRPRRIFFTALPKKCFQRREDGDHIYFYFLDKSGNETDIRTKISHGPMNETIGPELISKMARQCRLSRKQFLEFVDCKMTEEAYRDILREKGFDV